MIKVLVADDEALLRSAFSALIGAQDDLEVAGEAADGEQAVGLAASLAPDVVVMDLRMKRVDGIEATRMLSALDSPPVLALTTFNDDELLSGVLRAGASGFVLKDSSAEELIRAVRAVAQGLTPLATSWRPLRGLRPTSSDSL